MRIDRLGTIGVVSPIRRTINHFLDQSSPSRHLPPVTILMYHSISDDPEPESPDYFKVCTPPHRFAEQMQWLSELGYKGVTLSQGLTALNQLNHRCAESNFDIRKPSTSIAPLIMPTPAKDPERFVVITFDDGFSDFHKAAVPILRHHGFSATMYLPTGFVADARRTFKSRECLTWEEIRELNKYGFEFGSHTVSHPRLIQLAWPAIESELRDSRSILGEQLGCPIRAFSYPYAFPGAEREFSDAFGRLLARIGYESCVTTTIGRVGLGSDLFKLPRLPVNSADDRSLFEAKLSGAYDWLSLPQALLKEFNRWFRPSSRPTTSKFLPA